MIEHSKYFELKNSSKAIGNVRISEFEGWSGLGIWKFSMPEGAEFSQDQIDRVFPHLAGKEKILILTKGGLRVNSSQFRQDLKLFDAINLLDERARCTFSVIEDASLFMVSSRNCSPSVGKNTIFNFTVDIEPRDLWGGQIISRPFEGKDLTVVLFDLKPGFKFKDEGHSNEQITWLTEGEMDFYVGDIKKNLEEDLGVSIGPNQVHGGLSAGAVGFDAFFPKRIEQKYRK